MNIQEHNLSKKVQDKLNKTADSIRVVNDLTTGGANSALSAEMGKNIKAFIDKNAQDILAELSRKATNTTLGNIMVDGSTVTVDDEGKISASQPKYVDTENGIVALYPFSIEKFAGVPDEGLNFQLSINGEESIYRIYDIDLSIIPFGGVNTAHRIDMHISYERTDAGKIVNTRYTVENGNFKKDSLRVFATDNDGEEFITVEVRKPNTYTDTSTCLAVVNKIAVRGTEDFTAKYTDIENFYVELNSIAMGQETIVFTDDSGHNSGSSNIKVIDDSSTGGTTDAWSAEQGKMMRELFETHEHFTFNKIEEHDGDIKFLKDESLKLVDIYDGLDSNAQNKVLSAAQGKKLKGYVDDLANRPPPLPASPSEFGTMKNDGVTIKQNVNGQMYVDGYDKVKTDVQTLFTDWANETKNAATALTQKGVATAQDATMKTIVTNIGKIATGKRIYEDAKHVGTGTVTFSYVGSGTVNLPHYDIDMSTIKFKAATIVVEDVNVYGKITTITVRGGTLVSANVVNITDSNQGTSKWIALGHSGMPITGTLRIPVSEGNMSYGVTVYEE